MNALIRYTTPTITFKFDSVDPSDITDAYLSIKNVTNLSVSLITKPLSSASVGEDTLSWTLTQTETGSLPAGDAMNIYCDWKLSNGTRGRSVVVTCLVYETGKEEVI